MRLFSRRRLANRFGYSPFIRLLLFNQRFRLFLSGILMTVIALLVVVVRMWNVAPPGSETKIRINLIDMVQAANLARTAQRLEAAGNYDGAVQSWAAAIANYPTKPSLSRRYLQAALKLPTDHARLVNAPPQADRLIRLTRTNIADIELAARVYAKFGMPQRTLAALRGLTNSLSPELQIIWARALHDIGDHEAFEQQWRTNSAILSTDPELVLRRASVRELQGTEAEAAAARLQLEQAALGGTNRVLANRLLLRSAERQRDPALGQRALDTLVGLSSDVASDHAALWRMLIALERPAEAGALIQAYNRLPVSVAEAAEIHDLAVACGQTRKADELVDWSLANQGLSTAMCSRKAATLAGKRAWTDLRQLAIEIRLRQDTSNTLRGFGHFVEGRANLGENLLELARHEFAHLAEFDYDDPAFALEMAGSLIDLGEAAAALPLLSALEGKLENSPEFWIVLGKAALAERNSVLLLRAAAKSYGMNTNDPGAANNYATALVSQRVEPELALQLTSNLVARFPNAPNANLNHAAALLLNSHLTEARKHLGRLDPAELSASEANEFNFLSFNAAILARERETAAQLLAKIDRKRLFPPQLSWLHAAARSYLQVTNLPPVIR